MNNKNKFISSKKRLKTTGILSLCFILAAVIIQNAWTQKTSTNRKFHTRNSNPIAKTDKPNIIWITTEGVPLRVLSCYGSSIMKTPNIDRIAKEGMLFKNSFCTNALCAPSRATLLTGKYDHINGMLSNPGETTHGETRSTFDPSQETFAKILKQNGYKTGMVGKWHLMNTDGKASNPGLAGFDYFVFKNGAGGPYYNENGYFQNACLGSTYII
jgi:arylsulfatase A-like enzyme